MTKPLARIGPPPVKPAGFHLYYSLLVPYALRELRKKGAPASWGRAEAMFLTIMADTATGPFDQAAAEARAREWGGPGAVEVFRDIHQGNAIRLYEMTQIAPEAVGACIKKVRERGRVFRDSVEYQVSCILCDALGIDPDSKRLWCDGAWDVAAELTERLGKPRTNPVTGNTVEKARRRVRDALRDSA